MSKFSGGLQLTGLDDFITPSQACVNPVLLERTSNVSKIESDDAGGLVELNTKGEKTALKTASISLNDCLACSGCITSAEAILVESQSVDELLRIVEEVRQSQGKLTLVASISPQSRASVAAHFQVDIVEAQRVLTVLFQSLGAAVVTDTTFSRDLSLMEIAQEFVDKFRTPGSALPLLASSCPGWVCYAEKTHGDFVLPYISSTRSPQQIMGMLLKQVWPSSAGRARADVRHVALMPCYDKKLEASRPDFRDADGIPDVELVITASEILELLEKTGMTWQSLSEQQIDHSICDNTSFTSFDTDGALLGYRGTGSGGYAEYIFRVAAKELFNVQLPADTPLAWKQGRNSDVRDLELSVDGRVVLRFCIANGFRNIQNLVRKIKSGKSEYHFVEVMACPGGCLNGGGQIRPSGIETPRELMSRVEALYQQARHRNPEDNPVVRSLYERQFPDAATRYAMLHTGYHAVPKLQNLAAIKW